MQNPPPGYGYYGGPPGYPPPVQNYGQYGQYGGPSWVVGGSANPPPPGVEPDFGAALAEEFIHRCRSDKSRARSPVSQPPFEEEFIRKCREDRRNSASRLLPEEDFIRKYRFEREHSVSIPPREEEFIRKCRSVSRAPRDEGFTKKCRVDTQRSVSPLPLEEFIRKCRSGSRPPTEEEFIRQCKAGSRPPRSIGRSPSRSPVRSTSRRIRSRSRSPSRLTKSPIRSTSRLVRSRSRSPIRSASRSIRSRSRSFIRGLSRSPVPPHRPTSPFLLNKSGRSISPRRERLPSLGSRSQSRSLGASRSREVRRSRSRDSRKSHSSTASDEMGGPKTKRKELVDRWRMNCLSNDEVSNKLEEISKMKPEEIMEKEKIFWTRTAPADLYYEQTEENPRVYRGTEKLLGLCKRFETELIQRAARANEGKPPYAVSNRRHKMHHHRCCATSDSESEGSSEDSGEDDEGLLEELERKKSHPDRLHPELWYNDQGEMNDGPLCRCSAKAKRSGIRHNIYAGELNLEKCSIFTNNADRLHHYRITVSPPNNFLIKTPTIIEHDNHEYIFEGFSMFSHKPLENLPVCKVIRFNIEYTILYIKEKHPEHFIIKELDLFYDFLFKEILELVDLDFKAAGDSDGCSQFHFMPRFVRELPENGKELLSMNQVLSHLLLSSKPLISVEHLTEIVNLSNYKWQNYVDDVKGMVVTYPGKKPCSLRVDQLDRDQRDAPPGELKVPEIVHFGIRPPQLSYAGNPEYQKAWREYVKFRHLLANMPKASFEDKRKLESKENKLQEMRTQSKMKRDVTIAISAEGFYRTGIMCDIVQHAMLIPVLVSHLRFHRSLDVLETDIKYTFQNRSLLQLALTHPSYRENFGTNPDHARNSLTNCSIRQPEYGDRRIHYLNTRKRGINTLINIMSRFGKKHETESNITHNERLEFLGDAVVEFVTSIHLFHLFPRLEEGGLATYRAAIVQNQHLAVLAKKLGLDGYMLYAHGSDLCHDLELRHAMANCFEALMGALFLDGGIDAADRVFGESLFKESCVHLKIWEEYPPHPLQEQEPNGDRQWIEKFQILQNLTKFEDSIGVQFTHIRLLARAFTDRSIGFTNLTLGSNQRLEFLGDTVLQLIASDYLYKYFPEHHEGHLSLLRSSLVNNRTQAVVCDDLGIGAYAIYATPKAELKTKDRADLLEAFLGALYVDKGLTHCEVFCNVCFFPRLHDFIMHQDWNDPKSKLQQCCLTLRTMEGGEPEIPIYKVIECMGPTNTRLYTVAVYFKGKRLAQATGHSIQQAEMNAAKEALDNSQKLFPQLDHQKRVIAKSIKQDPLGGKDDKRRGQNDAGDRNRKNSRVRNARGRSASVRGSQSRDSSASRTNRLQPNKERSNTKNLSRQGSPSPTMKPSRTRSSSPRRKSGQLRSPSPTRSSISNTLGPRSISPLNEPYKLSPRTSRFHTKQLSPYRSPSPCRMSSSSLSREENTLRSPTPLRERSKSRSISPRRPNSSSLLRERSQLRKSPHRAMSPSLPRKQCRSPSSRLLREKSKLRSASPHGPRSPSPIREQSKPRNTIPSISRSPSPPREQTKLRNPTIPRPRSPSPLREHSKLRNASPHGPRSPSPIREQSKPRNTTPSISRSPSPPREQTKLRNPTIPRPRSPSQLREQSKLRSPTIPRPRSPSPIREQSKPRNTTPSISRSPSPPREQTKLRNPTIPRPRSPSPLREESKLRSPSPSRPRSPSPQREQGMMRNPSLSRRRNPTPSMEQNRPRSPSPPRKQSPPRKRGKLRSSNSPHEQNNLISSYPDRPRRPMSPKEPSKLVSQSPAERYRSPRTGSSSPLRMPSPSSRRSLSPARKSSRMKSQSPVLQSDYQSSSRNTKVSPKKGSKSRHKTSNSARSCPNEKLAHSTSPVRSTRPKVSSPIRERRSSKSPRKPLVPDGAGTKHRSRPASGYQEEHRTKLVAQKDKPSRSKHKDIEGEKIPTIDQIRQATRTHKFDQRKRPRMEESSPEKRKRESGSVRKKRRSKSRERESTKYYPAKGVDRKALSYYGYPIDKHQKDYHPNQQKPAGYDDRTSHDRTRSASHHDQQQQQQQQQQRNPGCGRHLDDRARKDSRDDQLQMKAYYEDYQKTLSEFRQQQQQKKPGYDDKTKPKDPSRDQQPEKSSPKKSRQRRAPSDEGEIVSESSADSRDS